MALDAAGPVAREISQLTLWLAGGSALLFVLVAALLGWALRARPHPIATRRWVVGGGLLLPAVVLVPLFADTLRRGAAADAPGAPMVVAVTARMWWWELRYLDPDGRGDVITANELRLPVGRTVRLALASDDVIHSVWFPSLAGKADAVPGRINHLVLRADRAGIFAGACAEFCGPQHARMRLRAIVVPAPDFARWLDAQRTAPAPPADDAQRRGRDAFATNGCAVCHRLDGLSAAGSLNRGPDLSHVSSRHTLGAGTLDNRPGALREWVADVQRLKPGARMPSYAHLGAATLDDLGAYLQSLK